MTFVVTFFPNQFGTSKSERELTLDDLAAEISTRTGANKAALPWLKLARFGDRRTEKRCLRNNGNVEEICGVEGDYDAGKIPVEEAIEILEKAGVAAIVYTSASYRPEDPHWRVLCPFSERLPPKDRDHMVGRLNGLLRGGLANESWTLCQAYYYGRAGDNPHFRVEVIAGTPIDLCDELDAIWRGKPKPGAKPKGNGAATADGEIDITMLSPIIVEMIIKATVDGKDPGQRGPAFARVVAYLKRRGHGFDAVLALLAAYPNGVHAKYAGRLDRELRRLWGKKGGAAPPPPNQDNDTSWADPDMEVLRLHRRPPPDLPLEYFGPWKDWIVTTAEAAACAVDYVAMPLLAAASVLIGHARWPQATPGWIEPSHLWIGGVGDSGTGKSPGADALFRDVLPALERRMMADFPDQLKLWRARQEATKAAEEKWKGEVRDAQQKGTPPPLPPEGIDATEPQAPCLLQSDITVEKLASVLATAAPKGVLIKRDELAGWIDGMNTYNQAGRAFWTETYGGRPYRVERQKNPEPICVPRLAVAVYGGTQPDKLALLMREADDGLLARLLWSWPDPTSFQLGQRSPGTDWAIDALDRLRELDLQPGDPPQPIMIPLAPNARALMEAFGKQMQKNQETAGGLMRSSYGKARGHALRLSLVLEMLWWCGSDDGMAPPPSAISVGAFTAAAALVKDYFAPMAERVYGDAATTTPDRNATTLARWIVRKRAAEVHVRHLQRKERLLSLKTAEDIHEAAGALIEADWLRAPAPGSGFAQGRARSSYSINPRIWDFL